MGAGVLGAFGGGGPESGAFVDLVQAGAADLAAAGGCEDGEPEGEFGVGRAPETCTGAGASTTSSWGAFRGVAPGGDLRGSVRITAAVGSSVRRPSAMTHP